MASIITKKPIDEDDLVSNTDEQAPTQQSVKAYVDAQDHEGAVLLDEDDLVSDSDTQAPTQQSVKAYVDGTNAIQDVNISSAHSLGNSANIRSTQNEITISAEILTRFNEDTNLQDQLDNHADQAFNVHGVTTILGATENQIITNKIFDDDLKLVDMTTPLAAAVGYKRLYPKADGNLYMMDELGVEIRVGRDVDILDEDDLVSDSDQHLATQQSIKAYVDNIPVAVLLDEDDMISNSDAQAATQQSIKAYVDTRVIDNDNLGTNNTRPPSQHSVMQYVDTRVIDNDSLGTSNTRPPSQHSVRQYIQATIKRRLVAWAIWNPSHTSSIITIQRGYGLKIFGFSGNKHFRVMRDSSQTTEITTSGWSGANYQYEIEFNLYIIDPNAGRPTHMMALSWGSDNGGQTGVYNGWLDFGWVGSDGSRQWPATTNTNGKCSIKIYKYY